MKTIIRRLKAALTVKTKGDTSLTLEYYSTMEADTKTWTNSTVMKIKGPVSKNGASYTHETVWDFPENAVDFWDVRSEPAFREDGNSSRSLGNNLSVETETGDEDGVLVGFHQDREDAKRHFYLKIWDKDLQLHRRVTLEHQDELARIHRWLANPI